MSLDPRSLSRRIAAIEARRGVVDPDVAHRYRVAFWRAIAATRPDYDETFAAELIAIAPPPALCVADGWFHIPDEDTLRARLRATTR